MTVKLLNHNFNNHNKIKKQIWCSQKWIKVNLVLNPASNSLSEYFGQFTWCLWASVYNLQNENSMTSLPSLGWFMGNKGHAVYDMLITALSTQYSFGKQKFFLFLFFFKVEQAPSAACLDHEGDHLLEILQPQLPWQCKELLPLASHLPDLTREHRPESHCKAGWGGGRLIEDFYCYYF